jgi:hypothetical protein
MALILDTGVVLAALNDRDPKHRPCVDLLQRANEPLVVPAAILPEVDYWIRKRMGVAIWRLFIEDIQAGAYALEPTTEADLVRAAELEEQYDDLGLGFVDAAVIALCERLREPKVATVDHRDFGVVVPRHVPSLELLPH